MVDWKELENDILETPEKCVNIWYLPESIKISRTFVCDICSDDISISDIDCSILTAFRCFPLKSALSVIVFRYLYMSCKMRLCRCVRKVGIPDSDFSPEVWKML